MQYKIIFSPEVKRKVLDNFENNSPAAKQPKSLRKETAVGKLSLANHSLMTKSD